MNGFVDLRVLDAPRRLVREADLLELVRAGRDAAPELNALLRRLPLNQRVQGKNLVLHWWGAYTFSQGMNGPAPTYPYNYGGAAAAFQGTLNLLNNSTEPTYQELIAAGGYEARYIPGTVTLDAFKRFVEDDLEPVNIQVIPGQEGISCRSRFLFSQSEAVSSVIRSVGVFFSANADVTSYTERASAARIRLKDSGGNPITVAKTGSQVLALEYTFNIYAI